jgi:4'-phosphopantetheinyl transferase
VTAGTLVDADDAWIPLDAVPPATTVEPGVVHVWRFQRVAGDAVVEQCWNVLEPAERDRACRFAFVGLRRAYATTHGMVRSILASYAGAEPADLRFAANRFGKPHLLGDRDADLRFNLTHSGHLAVLAVTVGRGLGVDVERMRADRDLLGIARRYFSPSEVVELNTLPPSDTPQGFYNCWTRKEAYVKGRGEGLTRPLASFDVSLAPGAPPALLRSAAGGSECRSWTLRALDAGAGYAGALAVGGAVQRLNRFDVQVSGPRAERSDCYGPLMPLGLPGSRRSRQGAFG